MSGATGGELPAMDLRDRIREAAFALLLNHRHAVGVSDLASVVGADAASVARALDELAVAGWIDRDEHGLVTGSAGLSLTTGPHRLDIDGARFRTWCAYDAIGIAASLGADATIETECAVCRTTISLRSTEGRVPADSPERLWLATGGSDLRGDFCAPTVLLCSPEHVAEWARRQDGRGRAVDLGQAGRLGAAAWSSAAATATGLRDAQGGGR